VVKHDDGLKDMQKFKEDKLLEREVLASVRDPVVAPKVEPAKEVEVDGARQLVLPKQEEELAPVDRLEKDMAQILLQKKEIRFEGIENLVDHSISKYLLQTNPKSTALSESLLS